MAAIVDRHGARWRLPALLRDGDRLIDELVRRTGRHDLAVWAETLHLRRRMGRATIVTAAGYCAGLAFLVASAIFYLR